MEREKLSSRIGFIFVSAGCAIGLGNVWRFPYITGQYGGAAFVLLYIISLVVLGLPILVMEFSIGRGGKRDAAGSFRNLQKSDQKWHIVGYLQIIGCVILMMFYTTIGGWCLAYFFYSITGKLHTLSTPEQIDIFFRNFLSSPSNMLFWMAIVVLLGFLVCTKGLRRGVERVSTIMMTALLFILFTLVIRAVTLDNASEGLKFYLLPDFGKMFAGGAKGFLSILYAAVGQAFFTLSLGIGAMLIFGSYIDKKRSLTGESIIVVLLDTLIALLAGLVIFPAAFAFGINPGAGPGLIFVTLPNILNSMPYPILWSSLFFLFIAMAALTTIIAVFENIISFSMSEWKLSRIKASIIVSVSILLLSIPNTLGFNVLSFIQPFGKGSGILDLLDFIVSNNLLPLGSLVYVFFCTRKYGWGWNNFITEANAGVGAKFPVWTRLYVTYLLPLIVLALWVIEYINRFFIK